MHPLLQYLPLVLYLLLRQYDLLPLLNPLVPSHLLLLLILAHRLNLLLLLHQSPLLLLLHPLLQCLPLVLYLLLRQ